jgi:hypothetical protein
MPAVSKNQRIAMAIAEHEPSKLYKRNKGMEKMSKSQLHDFASTKEKNLPKKAKKMVHHSPTMLQVDFSNIHTTTKTSSIGSGKSMLY